jgi:hypothetical protein
MKLATFAVDGEIRSGLVAADRVAAFPGSVSDVLADSLTPELSGDSWPLDALKPSVVTQLDYEAELVLVIGADARVAGYCVADDVSARDLQNTEPQWTRAKGADTFCPFGPWITTVDEVPDPATCGSAAGSTASCARTPPRRCCCSGSTSSSTSSPRRTGCSRVT